MRIATILSVAALGLSSAVIAQVTTPPIEQKTGKTPEANDMAIAANNGTPAANTAAPTANTTAPAANEATPVPTDTPDGSPSNAAPPAGEPNAATSAAPKR